MAAALCSGVSVALRPAGCRPAAVLAATLASVACWLASPFLSKVPSISPSGPVTFHARLPVGDSAAGTSLTAKLVGVIGLAGVGAAGVIGNGSALPI